MIPSSTATRHRDRYSIVVLDWPQRERQDIECYCIPSANLEDHDYIFQDEVEEDEDEYEVNDVDETPVEALARLGRDPPPLRVTNTATHGTKTTSSKKNRLSPKKWKRYLWPGRPKNTTTEGSPKDTAEAALRSKGSKPPLTEADMKQYISSQDDLDWSAAPDRGQRWQNPASTMQQLSTRAVDRREGESKIRRNIVQPLVEIYISDSRDDIDEELSVMSSDSCWHDERQGMVELILPNVLYYDEGRDDAEEADQDIDDNFHLLFPSYVDDCVDQTRGGGHRETCERDPTSISEFGTGKREGCNHGDGDHEGREGKNERLELDPIGQPEEQRMYEEDGTRENTAETSPKFMSKGDNFDQPSHPEALSTSSISSSKPGFFRARRRNSVTKYSVDLISSDVGKGSLAGTLDEASASENSKKNLGISTKKRPGIPIFGCNYVRGDDDDDNATIFSGFWKLFEWPAILRRKDQMDAPSTTSSNVADAGDSSSLGSLDGWDTVNNTTSLTTDVGLMGRDVSGDVGGRNWWELGSKLFTTRIPHAIQNVSLADNVTEVGLDDNVDDNVGNDDINYNYNDAASVAGSCTSATTVMLVETTTSFVECLAYNMRPDGVDIDIRDDHVLVDMKRAKDKDDAAIRASQDTNSPTTISSMSEPISKRGDVSGDVRGRDWWELGSKLFRTRIPRTIRSVSLAENVTDVGLDDNVDNNIDHVGLDANVGNDNVGYDYDDVASATGSCTSDTTVMMVEMATSFVECLVYDLRPDGVDDDICGDNVLVEMKRAKDEEGISLSLFSLFSLSGEDDAAAGASRETNSPTAIDMSAPIVKSADTAATKRVARKEVNKGDKELQNDGKTITDTVDDDGESKNMTTNKTDLSLRKGHNEDDDDDNNNNDNDNATAAADEDDDDAVTPPEGPFAAARRCDLDALQRWDAAHPGFDWTQPDDFGNSALYYGCHSGAATDLAVVGYLLDLWRLRAGTVPLFTLERCKACAASDAVVQVLERPGRAEEIVVDSLSDLASNKESLSAGGRADEIVVDFLSNLASTKESLSAGGQAAEIVVDSRSHLAPNEESLSLVGGAEEIIVDSPSDLAPDEESLSAGSRAIEIIVDSLGDLAPEGESHSMGDIDDDEKTSQLTKWLLYDLREEDEEFGDE